MPKRLNPNLAKIHRCYSVVEAAEIWGLHRQTIRNWIKADLPVIDETRPALIHGAELREFVRNKNQRNKRPCTIDEIYCLKCRKAQIPAELIVDYTPSSSERGCLVAICPDCAGVINRFVSLTQLDEIRLKLDVTIRPIENT